MAARHRAGSSARSTSGSHGKHRSGRAAHLGESGGLRGRRRRQSSWQKFVGWVGFGRRTRRERELLEAHLRELRLATATMRAEISVLRIELEQAMALAAQRRADTVRLAQLLPLIHQSFVAVAQRSGPIYLDVAPDVAPLETRRRPDLIDLEPAARDLSEIDVRVHASSPAQRRAVAASGVHRQTA